jgi:hypothetical protein
MGFDDVIINGLMQSVHKLAAIFFSVFTRNSRLERSKAGQGNEKRPVRIQIHRRDNLAARTREIRDHGFVMAKALFTHLAGNANITPAKLAHVERRFVFIFGFKFVRHTKNLQSRFLQAWESAQQRFCNLPLPNSLATMNEGYQTLPYILLSIEH